MEGDQLELYKLICLAAASIVVLFVVIFIFRDVFIDMRNQNIADRKKNRQRAKKVDREAALKRSKFKVYKGSNKKKTTINRNVSQLVKVK